MSIAWRFFSSRTKPCCLSRHSRHLGASSRLPRRRNARLIALLRLITTVMKVTRFTLSQIRLPQETQKLRVLQSTRRAFGLELTQGQSLQKFASANSESMVAILEYLSPLGNRAAGVFCSERASMLPVLVLVCPEQALLWRSPHKQNGSSSDF